MRVVDGKAEFGDGDLERAGDASDCRPAWVGLAAFDAGEGVDGDAGVVREVLLGSVSLFA